MLRNEKVPHQKGAYSFRCGTCMYCTAGYSSSCSRYCFGLNRKNVDREQQLLAGAMFDHVVVHLVEVRTAKYAKHQGF